jgi:cytochrome c-type biogenesis protein CcmH
VIRTQLSEGQSRQEVLDYFAQQYGNGVLANPPREGSGLIFLWLLPIAALALALLFFGGYLRTLRAAAAPNPAVASGARRETTNRHLPAGDLEPYIARIEQEVARFAKSRPNE